MIIHICGPSGSGKTYLGNRLKKKFGRKIVVKDLDDLRDEFIKSFYGTKRWTYINEKKYQNHIDKYITKNKKKIVVFVGLNDNTIFGKNKNLYYNLHSDYNFYIKISDKIIVQQKCLRLLNEIQKNKEAMNDLIYNNKFFIKKFSEDIKTECSLKKTIRMNKKWNKDYKKQKYKFMTRENIYKSVCKIVK